MCRICPLPTTSSNRFGVAPILACLNLLLHCLTPSRSFLLDLRKKKRKKKSKSYRCFAIAESLQLVWSPQLLLRSRLPQPQHLHQPPHWQLHMEARSCLRAFAHASCPTYSSVGAILHSPLPPI